MYRGQFLDVAVFPSRGSPGCLRAEWTLTPALRTLVRAFVSARDVETMHSPRTGRASVVVACVPQDAVCVGDHSDPAPLHPHDRGTKGPLRGEHVRVARVELDHIPAIV